jgi:hypothetical protein
MSFGRRLLWRLGFANTAVKTAVSPMCGMYRFVKERSETLDVHFAFANNFVHACHWPIDALICLKNGHMNTTKYHHLKCIGSRTRCSRGSASTVVEMVVNHMFGKLQHETE